jgi:hypothetical protein
VQRDFALAQYWNQFPHMSAEVPTILDTGVTDRRNRSIS